jgi:integrase
VGEWLDEWWELKKPTLSPTTVSSWRSSVERYLKPELGTTPLHEVRAVDLERLYQRRIESGLTAARVQRIHTVASVAFKAAVRRGLIATSPTLMAQVPAVGRQEPKAPSAEEVGVLLAAAADDPDLHALLVVAANTGARRAEVCALRWCDVNLGSRTMTISKSVAKGAGGGATIRQTKTGVVGQIAIRS